MGSGWFGGIFPGQYSPGGTPPQEFPAIPDWVVMMMSDDTIVRCESDDAVVMVPGEPVATVEGDLIVMIPSDDVEVLQ